MVDVNLATLTYWGYYLILNIGVSLSQCDKNSFFTLGSHLSMNDDHVFIIV